MSLYDNLAKLQGWSKMLHNRGGEAVRSDELAKVIDLIVQSLPEIAEDGA